MFYAYSVFSTITLEPIIRSNWNSNLFCILWYLTTVQRLNTILWSILKLSSGNHRGTDRRTDGHIHFKPNRIYHMIPDHLVWRGIKTTNHLTDTQLQKHKWIRIRYGQDNHQTFPDFGQYMVPRAEQIMLTLPEHLVILPVFVGVHTVSALFFVAFVFNSVYLFCPCYFYCLFLCNLCMAMFLNLWPFVLLLRYSFADIFITMTIILKSSWQFKCLGNIQYSGGVQTCFSLIKTPSFASFKIQYTRT
jgi:hypothetical protein